MFTGIVEALGKVSKISSKRGIETLYVSAPRFYEGIKTGDSVCVNGVCLTMTDRTKDTMAFDVMSKTRQTTNLRYLRAGDVVNLEKSLGVSSFVSGHFVYGHIDGVREIADIQKGPDKQFIDIELEKDDLKYVVEKGSIAVDGISLTIGDVLEDRIRLYIIPHTIKTTNLSFRKAGQEVNIEFDIIGKYVYRYFSKTGNISQDLLRKTGFMEEGS